MREQKAMGVNRSSRVVVVFLGERQNGIVISGLGYGEKGVRGRKCTDCSSERVRIDEGSGVL